MGNLFQELKRRKVFRVAVAYAVVAWVLIQISGEILPALQMPDWTVSFVTVLLLLGFPVALLLAWAFELAPDGAKTDSNAQPSQATTNNTDRKLIYAIFGLVLLVAGFQIADRFLVESSNDSVEESSQLLADTEPVEVERFNINLGVSYPKVWQTLPTDLAMSPNGQNIVYTVNTATDSELYVRNTQEREAIKLFENDEFGAYGAYKPKVSPNGQQVLFGSGSSLGLMTLDGGPLRIISRNVDYLGGWGWLNDSQITFVSSEKELMLYSLSSNSEERLNLPDDQPPRWPEGIPTKNAFLYTSVEGENIEHVRLHDINTGESRILLQRAYQAKYVPSGHIVFSRDQDIWAVPFDLESMQLNGPEVLVERGISSLGRVSDSAWDLSESGRLAFLPRTIRNPFVELRRPVWVDREGNEEVIPIEPGRYFSPRISPDGSKLALLRGLQGPVGDIVVWDFAIQRESILTFNGDVGGLIWSPDGTQLLYVRRSNQRTDAEENGIWRFSANGLGQPERLMPLSNQDVRIHFVDPRSNRLIYRSGLGSISNEFRSFSLNGDESNELLVSKADQFEAAVSPDGKWLAFSRREGGRRTGIFVSPYPNTRDGIFLVAADSRAPGWGLNSDEIYYVEELTRVLRSARVISTEPFLTEPGPDIASNIYHDVNWPPGYSVSPDGERILILRYEDEDFTTEQRLDLVIVDNWFEELKRLAPPDPQ